MANRIYHWKHGWIPLDHAAALSKAKGSELGARRYLAVSHAAGHAHASVVSGEFGGGTHVRGLQPVAAGHLPREKHITAAFDPQTRRFALLDQTPNHGAVTIPEHLGSHLHEKGLRIQNVTDTPSGKKVTAKRSDGTTLRFAADGSDIHKVDPQIVPPPKPKSPPPAASGARATHTIEPSKFGSVSIVRPVGGGLGEPISRRLADHVNGRGEKVIGYNAKRLTTVDDAGITRRYKSDGSNIDNPTLVKAATASNFKRKDLAGFQHVPPHEALPSDGSRGGNISALKVKRAYVKGNKRVLIEATITDKQAEEFLGQVEIASELTKHTASQDLTIHVPSGNPSFRPKRYGRVLGFVYGGDSTRVHINPAMIQGHVGAEGSQGGHHMHAAEGVPQILYTMVHEIGHTVDNRNHHVSKRFMPASSPNAHLTAPDGVEMDFHHDHSTDLSKYGRSSSTEGYAEAYAQFYLSKVFPQDPNSPNMRAARAYAERYGWV